MRISSTWDSHTECAVLSYFEATQEFSRNLMSSVPDQIVWHGRPVGSLKMKSEVEDACLFLNFWYCCKIYTSVWT